MAGFFRTKYKDEELVAVAEKALSQEPTVNTAYIDVTCEKGVVTLSGHVNSDMAKRHAVEAVRRMLAARNLKYDRLVDELTIA